MVVVPRDRRRRYGFFYSYDRELIDSEWDEIGIDTVLAACRRAFELHGVINLHPDGYASAQLQTPLICRPGDKPWRPLLPQLSDRDPRYMEATPGHWAERRRERDRRKSLPAEPSPVEPPPSRKYGRAYHPGRPRSWEAEWGEPPPPPPLSFSELFARAEAQQKAWRSRPPPPDWAGPTVTPGPPPAPPEVEPPDPLPAIEAPTLESALREFYRLYEGQGFSSRTKALYRSTVRKFLPGYQFPAHLR